jgi:hypothetical protein
MERTANSVAKYTVIVVCAMQLARFLLTFSPNKSFFKSSSLSSLSPPSPLSLFLILYLLSSILFSSPPPLLFSWKNTK